MKIILSCLAFILFISDASAQMPQGSNFLCERFGVDFDVYIYSEKVAGLEILETGKST